MMENNTMPKLRFREFSGEWEENLISKFFDIIDGDRGANYPNGDDFNKEQFCIFLNAKNVTKRGFDMSNLFFITNEKDEILNKGKLVRNDIVLTTRGTVGNFAFYDESIPFDHIRINSGMVIIRAIDNIISANYFYQYTSNPLFIKKIQSIAFGSAQPQLTVGQIKKFSIKFPLSLPEQEKIANYLSALDEKISLLSAKEKELLRYKKAMMQKLFAQEIRFKDDEGKEFPEWEEVQLKDILFEHKEKNKGNKYSEVFSVAKEKGVINQIEHLGRSYAAENIEHYKVINPFDVVYTKSPTSGFPFGIIKQNKFNRSGVLSPLYAVFRPKTKYIGMLLHDIFLSEVETYNYLVPLVQKGAKNTMNINNEDFLKGKTFMLPSSIAEQQKIADFLSAIDEKINKVQEQIEQTKSFKKAMLQQMFV